MNWGHQVWRPASLSTEPTHWPSTVDLRLQNKWSFTEEGGKKRRQDEVAQEMWHRIKHRKGILQLEGEEGGRKREEESM